MNTLIGNDISLAAELLKQGEAVAIPTETVYGLAANATNPQAVAKIFAAKERPFFDPLIIHLPSTDHLLEYVMDIPEQAESLMGIFWPGPLTLVLNKTSVIPDIVSSGLDTVGVRIPSHPMMLELLQKCQFPLAAPSANLFGRTSPTSANHVMDQLNGRIPYIVDGGQCLVGLESTIVGFPKEGATIYRLGGIPLEEIQSVVPNIRIDTHSSSNPSAPGMLTAHYAATKPTYFGNAEMLKNQIKNRSFSLISLSESSLGDRAEHHLQLSREANLNDAASRFFHALHEANHAHTEIILIEEFPDEGLGRAMNDRARRASSRDRDQTV